MSKAKATAAPVANQNRLSRPSVYIWTFERDHEVGYEIPGIAYGNSDTMREARRHFDPEALGLADPEAHTIFNFHGTDFIVMAYYGDHQHYLGALGLREALHAVNSIGGDNAHAVTLRALRDEDKNCHAIELSIYWYR